MQVNCWYTLAVKMLEKYKHFFLFLTTSQFNVHVGFDSAFVPSFEMKNSAID